MKINVTASAQRATRDQSEDYLNPNDVRVWRDAPEGGYVATRAVDEAACDRLNARAGARVWNAEIVDRIAPRSKAPINLHNVDRSLIANGRSTPDVLR